MLLTKDLLNLPEARAFSQGRLICYVSFITLREGSAVPIVEERYYRVVRADRSKDELVLDVLMYSGGENIIFKKGSSASYKISYFLRLYFAGKIALLTKYSPFIKKYTFIICNNQKSAYICVVEGMITTKTLKDNNDGIRN